MTTAILTEQQREAVSEQMPMLERIAMMESKRYTRKLRYDDALSSAMLGACQAVTTHDPNKASMATHVSTRAHGQIIDDIRTTSRQLGYSRWRHTRNGEAPPVHVSIDKVVTDNGREETYGDQMGGEDRSLAKVDDRDALEALAMKIAPRDARLREMIWLFYGEGLTMRNVGRRVGLSGAMVSILLKQARAIGKSVLQREALCR